MVDREEMVMLKLFKLVFYDCGIPLDCCDVKGSVILFEGREDVDEAKRIANKVRLDPYNMKYVAVEVATI